MHEREVKRETVETEKTKTNADAESSAAQAGTDTGQTQASAGSAGRGAGSSVGVGLGVDTMMDIGQAEAWAVNLKRLVENALNLDAALSDSLLRRVRNAEDFDQSIRALTLQSANNNQSLAHRVANSAAGRDERGHTNAGSHDLRVNAIQEGEMTRTVRGGDIALDRMWNVDEVAQAVAKTAVFQDAIAGAVAAAVAAVVSQSKAK